MFHCWCGKKRGLVQIPAGEIVSVMLTGGMLYSNIIMLARGKYDGALDITTAASAPVFPQADLPQA